MAALKLYTVFHLNLAYSSLKESDLPLVIQKCYWPLLNLAKKYKIAIEAPAYTLEKIKKIDPYWIEKLKELIAENKCEFLGSGYSQLIGPLVPAEVNKQNLKVGNEIYAEIFGSAPKISYLNEQAYSQGLIEHYLEAGYEAMMMEWNNPREFHPEWDKELQYHAQTAVSQNGEKISVIWNNPIAFQKFQRYAHGEMGTEEYLGYLASHIGEEKRFFPLYGSDAEVFDFRPGRYGTEAEIQGGEFLRIEDLFEKLSGDERFELAAASELLKDETARQEISLESPEQPIPVKKQGKYNVVRWGLTGRDDLKINTQCYRLFYSKAKDWKTLCYLWNSDFRTHAEEEKFQKFLEELGNSEFEEQPSEPSEVSIKKDGRMLIAESKNIKLELNCDRGLAINSLIFKKISEKSLIGTLNHGYFDDISLGADFYTGHTIIEIPGKPKITDLSKTDTSQLGAVITCEYGTIKKIISISEDSVNLDYEFDLTDLPMCSFKTGVVTLNPEAFDRKSLYVSCCNG
ncbi:MAG: hypothetical protein ACD_65C00280G0001, partial [uncultured bacterium]